MARLVWHHNPRREHTDLGNATEACLSPPLAVSHFAHESELIEELRPLPLGRLQHWAR